MPWVKRLALPASASTAASLAITSSAFLASGAQVCETVALGPDTPVVLPKLLISPAMSASTSALVSLKDRQRVVDGKDVSVRDYPGVPRVITKKKITEIYIAE